MSLWDQRYSEAEHAYGTAPNTFLASVADQLPAGPALCLASGQGRNAVFLAERGHAVTAVDLSQVGLDRSQELAAARGVAITTVCGDLSAYDLGEARWSVIVLIFAHMPPSFRRDLHQRCVRALAPGGLLVLEAYTPRQLAHGTGGPPVAPMLYEPEQLREDFAGLQLERLEELEREVAEGQYHNGLGAVVQVLARRA